MNRERRTAIHKIAAGAAIALGLPRLTSAQGSGTQHAVFLDATHADFEKHRTIFNKRIARTPKIIALCSTEPGGIEAVRACRYMQRSPQSIR